MEPAPALLPLMEPLRGLIGRWQGEGVGIYPTIETFRYVEEVDIDHVGKPFLHYQQRTRHPETGLPMHTETGYWRVIGPPEPGTGIAAVEVVIAHPTGISEILTGEANGGQITLETTTVARTPTAKEVTAVKRLIDLHDDVLSYELHMAAVGQPLQLHLTATLHRGA